MNYTLDGFIAALASSSPAPGGGGASALTGALASALGSMVANLTTGKAKYAQFQPDIDRIIAQVSPLTARFTELIAEDEAAFLPLSKAYSIPKDAPGRADALESALCAAAETPLALLDCCVELVPLLEELAEKGSRLAVSDIGVAAAFCRAAADGALMNVLANTHLMKNRAAADDLTTRALSAASDAATRCAKVYASVLQFLSE